MIKTKTFDLIKYAEDLSDLSDNFWDGKLKSDIIHFITREKEVSQDNLKVIISHPYEGNVLIINDEYIFYYIHALCKEYNLNPGQFTVITSNWQIFKQYHYWKQNNFTEEGRINFECQFLLSKIYAPKLFDVPNKNGIIPKINYEPVPDEPQEKEFVFNCLNKQPNRHRMTVYQHLMEKQLMHKGIVSFNRVGDCTLTGKLPEYLYNQLPITYDVPKEPDQEPDKKVKPTGFYKMSYGDMEFTHAVEQSESTNIHNNFAQFYQKSHLTLVTETLLGNMNNLYNDCSSRIPHHNGCSALMEYDITVNRMICPICESQKVNVPQWVKYYYSGFITEKTFRQFLNGHPMLWIAPPYTIKMLKHLGFKTFDTVWAEDYDEMINPRQRISRVITILTDLCNKDNNEWHVINQKLIPILKHNQELMLNLSEIPTLNWENIPDFITKNPQKDLYERYLDPAQGIEAVANMYYAGDISKAKKILDIS